MANTLDTIPNILLASAVSSASDKFAFLRDFTSDFSGEVRDIKNSTVKVPLYSAGSTVVEDPTSFGGGDATGSLVSVDMTHIHVPFYLTNADYANGYRLEDQMAKQIEALELAIQDKVFGLFTEANYGAPATGLDAIVAGDMNNDDLKLLWSQVKGNKKVCYLNSTEYSNFLSTEHTQIDPTKGIAYGGFSKLDYVDSFNGGTDICGFAAAGRSGVVMASAIPEVAAKTSQLLETSTFTIANGLTVALNLWGDTSSRADNASLDVLFGASVGAASDVALVKNA